MKKSIKYFVTLAISAGALCFSACSPEDHDTPAPSVSPEELVEGIAFSVTPDANDPNIIYLKSLIKGATPCWDTPNGISQEEEITLELPFAGDYPIKFGVTTGAGLVWGEPYVLTVSSNNFDMLSDEIWTNLAGGVDENGNGNPKVWVPMDHSYGDYQGSAPVGYMSPEDIKNDGSNMTDIKFGSKNWTMNWDPGFQSWLIPADDPYMGSEMELSISAQDGCKAIIKRVDGNGPSEVTGKFNLNNSDKKRPTLSFINCEMLHAAWGDGVCDNYSLNLKILECTPYVLQIATMRTNSEGPWWIVWNFVAKDVRDGVVNIPSGKPEIVEGTPVVEPNVPNLEEELFKISGADATYIASRTTFLLNEDKPYDYMWWNPGTAKWEWINGYGSSWAPALTEDQIAAFGMTLEKGNGTFKASVDNTAGASASTGFIIEGGKIVFNDEVTLLSAGNNVLKGREFTVLKCSSDNNEVVIGVPAETDATGAVNKYLCANMTIKPIGGGQTGPTVLAFDNEKLDLYMEANKYLRIQFYNSWAGKDDSAWPVDPTKLKLKKGQKFVIKFKIENVEWTGTPKGAVCCNLDENLYLWEPGCFDNFQAFTFNTAGENVVELVNPFDETTTMYQNGSFQLSIQYSDFTATSYEDAKVTVTSFTIE